MFAGGDRRMGKSVEVQGTEISIMTHDDKDFISLTDMLKAKDGTFSFFQRMTSFKNRDLFLRIIIHQFIGRKDSTGTCSYDQYIIFHK